MVSCFRLTSSSSTPTTVSDYVDITRTARHHRTESPKRISKFASNKAKYDKSTRIAVSFPGSFVLLSFPRHSPTNKIIHTEDGTYQVLSHEGSQYQLVNLLTGKSQKSTYRYCRLTTHLALLRLKSRQQGQITIWSTESYPTPANLQGIRQCGFVPAGWATAPTMIRNNRMQASRTISCSTNIAVSKTHQASSGCLQRRHIHDPGVLKQNNR
jgi:hypothetical protein